MAYGDALAAPTEFLSIDEILRRYPPFGPQQPEGSPARVTDDTQMALAVGEALLGAGDDLTPSTLERLLRDAFIRWNRSPENDRSPGMTCMTACERLEMGMLWQDTTVAGSKGCGANMRVQPVGLIAVDDTMRSAIAQFQAALTHGHPTGLAASDLTATVISWLVSGTQPTGLVSRLREYAHAQRRVYFEEWLGALWQRSSSASPEDYIERGWDECLMALDNVDAALEWSNRDADPCYVTGGGWVAEEAFATALLCFLLFPDDPPAVIRHAAVSSGDSDSIACIAGAFAGAHCGFGIWPAEWADRIEYRDRMELLGKAWD